MLLHAEETTRASFADSLKRSAKKFFNAAIEGGWTVTTESINGGSDRIQITARDLITALTWVGDRYNTVGPVVQIKATFKYDTGGFEDAVYSYIYTSGKDDTAITRKVDDRYNDDKLPEVIYRLTRGPIARRQEEDAQRQRKAEHAARTLRHEALVASRKATGDNEVDKKIREQLENITRGYRDKLDLSNVPVRNYEDQLENFHIRNALAEFATAALKAEFDIVGEFPNEVCLSIAEAAAYVAEDFVAHLVGDSGDSARDKARRKFVGQFHPIYGDRYGTAMQGVRIIRG